MNRIMLLIGCVALLTSCCIAKTGKKETACYLYQQGKATRITDSDSLAYLALRLLETSDDTVLMGVTKEMIASIKENDTALEIVYPDTLTVSLPSAMKYRIRRIMVPLGGEYGPGEDLKSAMILFGDGTYISPPRLNTHAKSDLSRIKAILSL
jgi:hypothetical protein